MYSFYERDSTKLKIKGDFRKGLRSKNSSSAIMKDCFCYPFAFLNIDIILMSGCAHTGVGFPGRVDHTFAPFLNRDIHTLNLCRQKIVRSSYRWRKNHGSGGLNSINNIGTRNKHIFSLGTKFVDDDQAREAFERYGFRNSPLGFSDLPRFKPLNRFL